MARKLSEERIRHILEGSNEPLDCEIIARKLNSLKYINQVDSILSKFEKQGLVKAV